MRNYSPLGTVTYVCLNRGWKLGQKRLEASLSKYTQDKEVVSSASVRSQQRNPASHLRSPR
jgi:hypothetical protein